MQKYLSWLRTPYWLNNFPKYLLAAVLIIVCLYPKFPFIRISGTYVSIRAEDFVILVLGIFTLAKVFLDLRRFLNDKIIIAFLLFFGAGLLSLTSGVFISHTVTPSIALLHFLRRIEYAVPLFALLALNNKDARNNLDYYIKILMIVTVVIFLYGFGQRFYNFPVVDTQNSEYSKGIALRWTPGAHINSTFAGHYDLASYIVLVLPIFTTLFFLTDKRKLKLWLLCAIVPGLWLLGASLSRVSLASWVLASCLSLVLVKKYKETLAIIAAAVLIVLAFPSFLGRYQQLLKIVDTSLFKMEVMAVSSDVSPVAPVSEDRSTSIRLYVEWPRAIMAFYKNPALGTGYSSIGLATDNDYLRTLGEVGLLGLTAFSLIFCRIGKVFWKFIKNRKDFDTLETSYIAGIIGAVVGTFLTAIFIDVFEASKFATIYWLLIGYAVILVRNEAPQPNGRGIFSQASSGAESLRSEASSLQSASSRSRCFAKGDKQYEP